MTKFKLLSSLIPACLAVAFQASAQVPTPLTSANPNYQDTAASTTVLSNGKSISGLFNLETDTGNITIANGFVGLGAGTTYTDHTGFNPLTQSVVSGTLSLWIKDTDGHSDSFSVNLGGNTTTGSFPGGTPGSHAATFNFTDGPLTSGAITLLNNNGQLGYTITDTGTGDSSDFTVNYAVLQVSTVSALGGPVPDASSTAILLGGALIAMSFVKRKLA